MSKAIDLEEKYCAHDDDPLPVVLTRGDGAFVRDEDGRQYLDSLSAVKAVRDEHAHPALWIRQSKIDSAVQQIPGGIADMDDLRMAG